jgi:diguanylate cyclase (GGDEF)-like protein
MHRGISKKGFIFFMIAIVYLFLMIIFNRDFFYFSIDIFSAMMGLMMFILASNSKEYTRKTALLLIATLYLYVSCFDLMKLTAYFGVGYERYSLDIAIKWFTSARILELFGLFLIVLFFKLSNSKVYLSLHFIGSIVFVSLLLLEHYNVLPTYYSDGLALIVRLIYLMIAALFLVLIYIFRIKYTENKDVTLYLTIIILLKALSSILYSQSIVFGDVFYIASDILRFLSYAGLYLVFIRQVVSDPYSNLHKFFIDKERELLSLSELDSMTGLYNHSTTFVKIEELILNVGKTHVEVCVILFDIDNFKQINDSFGHTKGDEILVTFTDKLNNLNYKGVIVGRYGGDEFVMALPNIDNTSVDEVFLKIGVCMKEIYKEAGIKITYSAGVVFWKIGDNATDMIRRADIKMYESKERGKNQFTIWKN